MQSSEYISIEQVYSDLVTLANDEDSKSGLDRGFYISRIQQAVQFFALESYYQTITKDVFDFDQDGTGTYTIPTNCFNIKEIYLFNGGVKCPKKGHEHSCTCSQFNIQDCDYQQVHWKRTLSFSPTSNRKMMKIKKNGGNDALNTNETSFVYQQGVIYGNVQSGVLILGEPTSYKNLRIIYNGMGSERGEIPSIPRIIQDGITDKAAMDIFEVLKNRNNQYRVSYVDAYNKFYGTSRDKGSYKRCKSRIAMMDTFKRESLKEYLGNADWL